MQDIITGLLIRTDGTASTVTVNTPEGSPLNHMRALIDARCVDVICLDSPFGSYDAWIDDEGVFTADENIMGTVILAELEGERIQPIFGHVLLLSHQDEHTTSLTADQIEYAHSIHALAQSLPMACDVISAACHKVT